MPSFPRRRESCLIFKNRLKNNLLHKLNQDSRLRGNDGELTISYGILGFAKVSGCLTHHNRLPLPPIPLRPAERSILFSEKSVRLSNNAPYHFTPPSQPQSTTPFFRLPKRERECLSSLKRQLALPTACLQAVHMV